MEDSIIWMISSSTVWAGVAQKGKKFTKVLSFNGIAFCLYIELKLYLHGEWVYYGRIYRHGYSAENDFLTSEI